MTTSALYKPLVDKAGQQSEAIVTTDVVDHGFLMVKKPTIATGDTVTVPDGYQMLVAEEVEFEGTLDVIGELHIL